MKNWCLWHFDQIYSHCSSILLHWNPRFELFSVQMQSHIKLYNTKFKMSIYMFKKQNLISTSCSIHLNDKYNEIYSKYQRQANIAFAWSIALACKLCSICECFILYFIWIFSNGKKLTKICVTNREKAQFSIEFTWNCEHQHQHETCKLNMASKCKWHIYDLLGLNFISSPNCMAMLHAGVQACMGACMQVTKPYSFAFALVFVFV